MISCNEDLKLIILRLWNKAIQLNAAVSILSLTSALKDLVQTEQIFLSVVGCITSFELAGWLSDLTRLSGLFHSISNRQWIIGVLSIGEHLLRQWLAELWNSEDGGTFLCSLPIVPGFTLATRLCTVRKIVRESSETWLREDPSPVPSAQKACAQSAAQSIPLCILITIAIAIVTFFKLHLSMIYLKWCKCESQWKIICPWLVYKIFNM